MSSPMFNVGESICSDKHMGKIQFAVLVNNDWQYFIEQLVLPNGSTIWIPEADIREAFRDKQWFTVNSKEVQS